MSIKVIFEDTRNKIDKNKHIHKQLEDMGYKVERTKLYCGDYTFPTNQSICIDTKANLNEVENNLIHDHERFKQECIKAQESGIKLIVLIQEPNITNLIDVCSWYNWRKKKNPRAISGKTLYKIMSTMAEKYNIEWQFTTKSKCGERIIELLGGS